MKKDQMLKMGAVLAIMSQKTPRSIGRKKSAQALAFNQQAGVTYIVSRTNCRQCGKTIPPGKTGRRCEECRNPPQIAGLEVPIHYDHELAQDEPK